jgi:glycosyltransferase involved in cell wall biosynthesis
MEGNAIKRVALTTWETSPMPTAIEEVLETFDSVIVPSEFCESLAIAVKTHVVPQCFDETWWEMSRKSRYDMMSNARPFRFYTIGAWGERKNTLGLLRAYLSAFTSSDRVSMTMLVENVDLDEIRSLIARSGLPAGELPELHIPGTREGGLSEDDLLELHAQSDCFVSATRGEGWGLGLFEAAIMGNHVITPMCGGHDDFLENYAWAHAVPYQFTPCFGGESRMRVEDHEGQKVQISKVALPPGVDCRQSWADPDLEALAHTMKSLYKEHAPRAPSDMREERLALERRFGYRVVGPQLATTLREIATS